MCIFTKYLAVFRYPAKTTHNTGNVKYAGAVMTKQLFHGLTQQQKYSPFIIL